MGYEMKLSLVLQCISTWDYEAINEPLLIRIDGKKYPFHVKPGGYHIFTSPIPVPFDLSVQSPSFFLYEWQHTSLPSDKIIPIQLTPRYPRGEAAWLSLHDIPEPRRIVLGYGYHRLASLLRAGDETIKIKNPLQRSLEGRCFMLRDTQSGDEEMLTLGGAADATLEMYQIPPSNRDYGVAAAALLPAFDIMGAGKGPIPLRVPPSGAQVIWLYAPQAVRLEVTRGQRLEISSVPSM